MSFGINFYSKSQDGVLTLEEASKTFRVMGKRPTGKKITHFLLFVTKHDCTVAHDPHFFANLMSILPLLHFFPNSEDEILKMVREVSDDKKNDSLEFNEFLKVREVVMTSLL